MGRRFIRGRPGLRRSPTALIGASRFEHLVCPALIQPLDKKVGLVGALVLASPGETRPQGLNLLQPMSNLRLPFVRHGSPAPMSMVSHQSANLPLGGLDRRGQFRAQQQLHSPGGLANTARADADEHCISYCIRQYVRRYIYLSVDRAGILTASTTRRLDCTPELADELEGLLASAEKAGVAQWGAHRQTSALMI
jgi:hypothetical protein